MLLTAYSDHYILFSGSGKSYLAKFLRDLEVENGGNAPRIHSMDDYFMTEVEKVFACISLAWYNWGYKKP